MPIIQTSLDKKIEIQKQVGLRAFFIKMTVIKRL